MINGSGIYKIYNKITSKCYIGSAVDVKSRFRVHKSSLRLNKHHSIHLQRAWNKYWEHLFEFSIIEYCEKQNLIKREQFWIDHLNCVSPNGYNLSPTAYSQLGIKRSEETKLKLSIAHRKAKRSEEFKRNVSLFHKGKVTSEETKRKMRLAAIGRKMSEEAKKKMSINSKNRIISKEVREKMKLTYHRNRLISSFVIEAC